MPSPHFNNYGLVTVTDSTVTITDDAYVGNRIVLSRAAGITVTLPAATGSGNRYEFIVLTTVTSNGYIVKVPSAAATMIGNAIIHQDAANTVATFEAGATADTITLNGTTTGGLAGAVIILDDIAADKWLARVESAATGTEATPFSATVS